MFGTTTGEYKRTELLQRALELLRELQARGLVFEDAEISKRVTDLLEESTEWL